MVGTLSSKNSIQDTRKTTWDKGPFRYAQNRKSEDRKLRHIFLSITLRVEFISIFLEKINHYFSRKIGDSARRVVMHELKRLALQ